jgi:hypothetical protein
MMHRLLAIFPLAFALIAPAVAVESEVRVKGYFCSAQSEQVAFLTFRAGGESEEMAANAVNKSLGKFTCAYYRPASAIQTGEKTVMRNGLVFRVESYLFLPEKVERWTGTVFGSLQPNIAEKDI